MLRPALLLCLFSANLLAAEPAGVRLFREKIEPVLRLQCYHCHSEEAEELQAGLKLDSAAALSRGGDSGPVIVAGHSDESLLIQALRHENGLAMPPNKPRLPDHVIADFAQWIDAGAPDPRPVSGGSLLRDAAREHWAFQSVHRPKVPAVQSDRSQNPIDAFVLAKLEEHGWSQAPAASRAEFIRRVTFDLHGLPPTPEEIAAFAHDPAPDAHERLVDRLLASSHYGERAAQLWLDVIRYAETEGYEYDRHIPDAWRFRDYVIRSFNSDKPFDQFIIEQLAGDELAEKLESGIESQRPASSHQSVPALGSRLSSLDATTAAIFHRLGPVRRNAGNPDIALSRNEVLTERTDIIGPAFLGLTIGCARCHNHKLEPITQKDYYRLQAYFAATEEHNLSLAAMTEQQAWDAQTQRLKDELTLLKKRGKDATGQEKQQLEEQIEQVEAQLPAPLATIPTVRNDARHRTPIHVLKRGVWELKGEPVGPRPLSVLVPDDTPELPPDFEHPRTHLARWIASPDHPLTARVIVNRLWQQHFGNGLVKTANDFGVHGERPSHPELLDWLAATLLENGWQLKRIHRLIVLSDTYRQAFRSPHTREYFERDPENRLLWRGHRRRLTAEELRDAMLAVSGRLNSKMEGRSVIVPADPQLVALLYKPSQWAITPDTSEHDRRSIYLIAKRNLRLPFLETLDAPALQTSCSRREASTHAPQALELLNGTLSTDLALAFAQRLRNDCGNDDAHLIERAWQLALGRPPHDHEREIATRVLRELPLHEFTLALFNLNAFVYVP